MNAAPGAGPGPALLRIRGLEAGYGALKILDGVDLEVHAGEVVAIIGPNGAGKSTLLRVLVREIRALRGSVELPPEDPSDAPERRPAFLRLAQEPDLPPFLSLLELVTLAVRAWRAQVPRPADLARSLLADWGLGGRVDRPIRLASPGEIRRTLLALVEAVRPRLLLLDEVLSALDPAVVLRAQSLLERLGAAGSATVLVSHDLGLTERLAARVLLLHEGKIQKAWSRETIESERREGRTLLDLFIAATGNAGEGPGSALL